MDTYLWFFNAKTFGSLTLVCVFDAEMMIGVFKGKTMHSPFHHTILMKM